MRQQWKSLIPVVLRLPRYARLVFALSRDPRLGAVQKAALGGAVLYNISPVDIIPGVIPVLGQLDDMAVLLYTARRVLNECPAPVARDHLLRSGLTARQMREDPEIVRRVLLEMMSESGRLALKGVVSGGHRVFLALDRVRRSLRPH